jgi:tRNA G10  N-methylase Trm11
MNFCILGSQPNLSLAEIVSVITDIQEPQVTDKMLVLNSDSWNGNFLMNKLGGTVKLGEILYSGSETKLTPKLIADLLAPNEASKDGKRSLDFGLTVYGSKTTQKKFFRLPILLKKELKNRGYSVRWVTGKGGEPLSPAAVSKCNLCDSPNADLCIAVLGNNVFLGKTTNVQNADSWSIRDFDRPKRDSKNGMLPPKLARIMVNLAQVPSHGVILDPFCGSGTILMEAVLATDAKQIIGSDIEEKQISYTEKNNNWLVQSKIISAKDGKRFRTFTSDVLDIQKFIAPKSIDAIITEGYLGPPLHGTESQKSLDANAAEIQKLWVETLRSIKPTLKPSAKLVIITPEYSTSNGHSTVNLDDVYKKLGFKKQNPDLSVFNTATSLSYFRENQFVKRNITLLRLI